MFAFFAIDQTEPESLLICTVHCETAIKCYAITTPFRTYDCNLTASFQHMQLGT